MYQIIGIFLLALAVRLIALGNFPVGFHVDEVKVGWNALSILRTLKDDHNMLLPLYYNTFGDFRPTGIFYLSIPALAIFKSSIFAVRFTSALFGALTVFPLFLLSNLIFKKQKNVGLFAGLILALSPWHISVSRATSEVVISGFFVMTAIYFAYTNKQGLLFHSKKLFLGLISILISYFLYHSARILLPIYLLFITFKFNLDKKFVSFAIVLTLVLTLGGASRERFSQVSLFNSENVTYELQQSKENKIVVYTRSLIKEYGRYFSTDFLIGEAAKPYRYLTPGVGLLNYVDLFLLLTGIYLLINKKNWTFIIFLVASPLAAILTYEDSPNLHRSLYMIFFIAIIEGYALSQIKHKKTILFIILASFIYFLSSYFRSGLKLPYQRNLYIDSPTYRNMGNVDLAKKIESYKNEYDLIYITNFPDNLYPWYAFFNDKDPKGFNSESFELESNERRYENIIFTDDKCPSDYVFSLPNIKTNKVLVIDSGQCATDSKIRDGLKARLIEEIKRPDDSVVFAIFSQIPETGR